MDAGGLDAVQRQVLGQAVGAVLGAGEDQECALAFLQQMHQQREFAAAVNLIMVQIDVLHRPRCRADGDAHRVADRRFDQLLDGLFDGRREEQRLAFGRQLGDDLLDGRQETHVEHAVRFIEHEDLRAFEVDQAAFHEIAEAAGGGDDNLRALADIPQLILFVHSADNNGRADLHAGGQVTDGFVDLDGQFASGAQDDGANTARGGARSQFVNDG